MRTRGAGWGRRRPGTAADHWNDRCHAWNRVTAPCSARARSTRRTKGSDTTEPFIGFNLLGQLIDREGGVRYYSVCRTVRNWQASRRSPLKNLHGSESRPARIHVIRAGRRLAPRPAREAAQCNCSRTDSSSPGASRTEHGAIDLATGAPVTILTSSAGGASDQIRWSVRCDRFFRLHHRCIARLVDYGLVGQATRFEAWQCGERWRGSRRAASGTLARATIFLHAIASDGEISVDDIRTDHGRPVLMPGDAIGCENGGSRIRAIDDDLASCGITTIHRRSIEAVAEVLGSLNGPAPQPLMLGAVEGAGASVAIHQLARVARLNGFVPLALPADSNGALIEAIGGRTLCLIDRRGRMPGMAVAARTAARHAEAARASLDWRARAAEGAASSSRARSARKRWPLPSLRRSSRHRLRRVIERAAKRSDGLPAKFAELLWGPAGASAGCRAGLLGPPAADHRSGRIAAERPPAYGEPAFGAHTGPFVHEQSLARAFRRGSPAGAADRGIGADRGRPACGGRARPACGCWRPRTPARLASCRSRAVGPGGGAPSARTGSRSAQRLCGGSHVRGPRRRRDPASRNEHCRRPRLARRWPVGRSRNDPARVDGRGPFDRERDARRRRRNRSRPMPVLAWPLRRSRCSARLGGRASRHARRHHPARFAVAHRHRSRRRQRRHLACGLRARSGRARWPAAVDRTRTSRGRVRPSGGRRSARGRGRCAPLCSSRARGARSAASAQGTVDCG